MSDVKEIEVLGRVINIKDAQARAAIEDIRPEAYGSEIVVLGDSFTQGYLAGGGYANPNMPTIIASELGLNLHNYGVNASGYTLANSFQSQANAAIADTSYDHARVKYVLVIGGINDANAVPKPDCSTASKLLQQTLASTFPTADIFIIPNWGGVALDIDHTKVFRSICSVANDNSRVSFLYDNLKTLIGYYTLMGADNVHPTQDGYYVMAKAITAMILGGNLPRSKALSITAGAGWDVSNLNVIRGEDDLLVYGYVTATQTITASETTIAVLPPDSGCVGAGSYIESIATNYKSYPIDIEPGVSLIGYEQNGFIGLQNDRGNTIAANTNIAINFRLPIIFM